MFRKLYIAYYCYYAFQFNTRHRQQMWRLEAKNEISFMVVCMCLYSMCLYTLVGFRAGKIVNLNEQKYFDFSLFSQQHSL